jgi:predicted amidohydrolase YtcJ
MVSRKGYKGESIDLEQQVSVEQALKMYTINGAKVFGKEDKLGSLDAGKIADIIILSEDPRNVPVERLKQIEVDYVFRGGELVYERLGAKPLQETFIYN